MREARLIPLALRRFAPGFDVWSVHSDALGRSLDPYLACDVFEMQVPHFPPHPHAGFSAVTYMLPTSEGGFVNRDSLGDRSFIMPGDVHWTEAANGIMHEEVPIERGVVARGLQLFVDLPADQKNTFPKVYHRAADQIPRRRFGDAVGRLITGADEFPGGAIQPRTSCLLVDLEIPPRGIATMRTPSDWSVFGLRLEGALSFETADDEARRVNVVDFGSEGGWVVAEAGERGARLVLLGGRPLRQPLVHSGPFVMSSTEELTDAKRRFAAGDMGHLAPSF